MMPLIKGEEKKSSTGMDRLALGGSRVSIYSNRKAGREHGHRHTREGKCGDVASGSSI